MPTTTVTDLSPEERLALIAELWDSLDDADITLTPAQRKELDRRLAAAETSGNDTVAWSDLREEISQRLR